MVLTKETIKEFMDIADLERSRQNLNILHLLVAQEVEIRTLKSLLSTKMDTYAFDCAKRIVVQDPEIDMMCKELSQAAEALKAAAENPQARLQAMMKAKLEGRL